MSGAHRHLDPKTKKWNTTVEGEHTHEAIEGLETRVAALEALVPDAPEPPVVVPPVIPPSTGTYGPGVAMDSKNNEHLGWDDKDNKVSHRFKARTTSPIVQVAINLRGGVIYSQGDGGIVRVGLQADAGGKPDGSYIGAQVQWKPGNPAGDWENQQHHAWAGPTPTEGRIYHLVMDNVHADPRNNAVSVNESFVFGHVTTPAQAAFGPEFAVLTGGPNYPWTLEPGDTPVFDLVYANGQHDGNAYFGNILSRFGLISGLSKVRERFTPTKDQLVTKAFVRIGRQRGSAPLTIRLLTAGGTLIEDRSVDASGAVLYSPGADARNGDWFSVSFSQARLLKAGTTYDLVLSTDASTQYSMVPIRENSASEGAVWGSYAFREGTGQFTVNDKDWSDLYPWAPCDMQCYFAVA